MLETRCSKEGDRKWDCRGQGVRKKGKGSETVGDKG